MVKTIFICLIILVSTVTTAKECSPLLDFDVRTLNENKVVNLCQQYQGKVIMVVNTASKCAYTDQYSSLENLYQQYQAKGLVVLGFPSNDFGAQEPGSEKQIKDFCRLTYGVQFPMFSKTRVSERYADPLYQKLASSAGRYPQWNFHKYLIGRDGHLVADYPSSIDPLNPSVIGEINKQLAK
jgi:glutathione peroxidase